MKLARDLVTPIKDEHGKPIYTPSDLEKMADDLIAKSMKRCFFVTARPLIFGKDKAQTTWKCKPFVTPP